MRTFPTLALLLKLSPDLFGHYASLYGQHLIIVILRPAARSSFNLVSGPKQKLGTNFVAGNQKIATDILTRGNY